MINFHKSRLDQNGLTIVEIIIGLSVLLIFVGTISVITKSTNALNDQSADIVIANGIAEEKIEALRSAGFLNLPINGTVVDFSNELSSSFQSPRLANYTVTDENTSLKKVDILIRYTVGGNIVETNYSSFIGELGVGQ